MKLQLNVNKLIQLDHWNVYLIQMFFSEHQEVYLKFLLITFLDDT